MFPEFKLLPFLDFSIKGYGLMIVIGFLICTWLAARETKRRGIQVDVYNFGVVLLITGLIGGRLFYYWQFYEEEYQSQPWYKIFAIWEGGLVFYGGAIGGILGSWLYLRLIRIPAADLFDAISSFIPIGMGFGRLGCLMNGCCYGAVCPEEYPLGITFPARSPAFLHQLRTGELFEAASRSLPVYPVQIIEALIDFFLCGILFWYSRGPSPRGGMLPLLFFLYSIGRFSLEFWRADNDPVLGIFTISQVIAAGLFVVSASFFAYSWMQGLRQPLRAEKPLPAA